MYSQDKARQKRERKRELNDVTSRVSGKKGKGIMKKLSLGNKPGTRAKLNGVTQLSVCISASLMTSVHPLKLPCKMSKPRETA